MRLSFAASATCVLVAALSSPAAAQDSGAQSTFIDPSIRASGMGRTGAAVFWGDDPNDWANPALLGYRRGVRFDRGRTQLVPDLVDDVFFTSNRILIGGFGVGLATSGKPLSGFGGMRLEYGASEVTDEDGNALGTVTSYEDIESFSVGVNVLEFLERTTSLLGANLPRISRFGDVSLGQAWKSIAVTFGSTFGDSYGEADEKDRGFLVRLTPYNAVDFPGALPGIESALRARLDVSVARSEINYDAAGIGTFNQSQVDPIVEDKRRGLGIHLSATVPEALEERYRSSGIGWLVDLLTPVVSFGASWEETEFGEGATQPHRPTKRNGWEGTLLNLFTYRHGHVDDPDGTIDGDTSGWSVGLRYARVGGIRYDRATVPQATFLDDVKRSGFTAYADPFEVWMLLR